MALKGIGLLVQLCLRQTKDGVCPNISKLNRFCYSGTVKIKGLISLYIYCATGQLICIFDFHICKCTFCHCGVYFIHCSWMVWNVKMMPVTCNLTVFDNTISNLSAELIELTKPFSK